MGSNSRQRTTMAKHARERALREKRMRKQQKKDERKQAAAEAKTNEGDGPPDADGAPVEDDGDL